MVMASREPPVPGRSGKFLTTQWSVVHRAGQTTTAESRAALAVLCGQYWYPLYAFIRRQGCGVEEAQDLTQEFFTRVLEKHYLQDADPARGRFRSFLLASVRHFMSNERDRARALKRGGDRPPLPLEFETAERRYSLEPRDDVTPEKLFERRWALTLLDRVVVRTREEYASTGRGELFDALRGFLTGEGDDEPYRQVGARLGMSEGAVKVAVHRLRQRFRTLMRDEIGQTVANPQEIDTEIRHLFGAVRS
jgi:RNA polymerase sigma-70 factor (ECF subfamily)